MAEYSALGPVQEAVYKLVSARILSDSVFKATIGAIYDQADPGTPFPYVTLGDGDHETNVSDFDTARRDVIIALECWSGDRSYKQSSAMVSALCNLIGPADDTLQPSGWTIDQIHYDGAGPKIRDVEGVARQIPVTFTITVEQT